MSRKVFGTDGIRGVANKDKLTPENLIKIAMAAAKHFKRGDHQHKVVIGKDTRLSGYMVEQALTTGLLSMGMNVVLIGPMPTPAIPMLTRSLRADMGIMITASHNPYQDNGIKFFGPDGYKLCDAKETEIEANLKADLMADLSAPDELGRATRFDDASGRYIEFAKSSFPRTLRLDGMKIAVDCANGATYKVAPQILWELGAEVIPVGCKPDGTNINDNCGATSVDVLQQTVVTHGADIGLAFDGDGDRLMVIDNNGKLIDGDQIMALLAMHMKQQEQLRGDVVATILSNMGLERFLNENGVGFVRTAVGDRYIVEHMRKHDCNLGGEQSGHMILGDFSTTGDGIIAALQVLAMIQERNKPASEVCDMFKPYPQIMLNVRYDNGNPLDIPDVQTVIKDAEQELANNNSRMVVRKSGTEPLIRILTEGQDEAFIKSVAENIAKAIETKTSA